MAKKGYIVETRLSAKDVDAFNRSAKAEADIDGGTLVKLGNYANGVFTATKSTDGKEVWMAYNPEEHLTQVGDNIFAGLSADPRDYTNLAGRPFGVAKLQLGDIVTFTDGNLKADETPVKDQFIEQGEEGYEAKSSATEGTTSFKVLEISTVPFPQGGIGQENAKVYVCEVAQLA